jgi:hypothetical protein
MGVCADALFIPAATIEVFEVDLFMSFCFFGAYYLRCGIPV